MSELAYEADHRARYGCLPDEDPPWPDDEHKSDATEGEQEEEP